MASEAKRARRRKNRARARTSRAASTGGVVRISVPVPCSHSPSGWHSIDTVMAPTRECAHSDYSVVYRLSVVGSPCQRRRAEDLSAEAVTLKCLAGSDYRCCADYLKLADFGADPVGKKLVMASVCLVGATAKTSGSDRRFTPEGPYRAGREFERNLTQRLTTRFGPTFWVGLGKPYHGGGTIEGSYVSVGYSTKALSFSVIKGRWVRTTYDPKILDERLVYMTYIDRKRVTMCHACGERVVGPQSQHTRRAAHRRAREKLVTDVHFELEKTFFPRRYKNDEEET